MAGDEDQAEAGRAATIIQSELVRIRASARRIEQALADLEDARGLTGSERPRPERYLRVLLDVYERGGQHGVDGDAFALIGDQYGYDRRGLGGFFTGARAPLRRVGERIVLTVQGHQLLDAFLAGMDS